MTKQQFLICTILLLSLFSYSQTSNQIQWLSFEEAEAKQKETPKKIFVDAYTDWCGWCKHLDKTTFADPGIAQYINTYYYPVKFNAETTDTIIFKGKEYVNKQVGMLDANGRPIRRPTHELAFELMGKRMSFPTIIYLDEQANVIAPIGGYFSAIDIQPIIVYFAENLHKSENLQDFIDDFKTTFIDSLKTNEENIKWLSLDEALKLNQKTPRNIVISFDAPWGVSAKMMHNKSFNNKDVAEYINKNMYPVKFDMLQRDSLVFAGYTFKNENAEHPYHDFAIQLLNGNMKLPANTFISSELKPITNVPGYFNSKAIMPLLIYFNEDYYLKYSWNDFLLKYPDNLEE